MDITHNLLKAAGFFESEPHKFVGEASSLGLAPGDFPIRLESSIGNSQPFLRSHSEWRDGDLLWVDYDQSNGDINLRIFND
jgi:hypothetical protein